MKKITMPKIFLIALCFLIRVSDLNSQVMLKEISLEQQIKASNLVIEGRVINKESYWNAGRTQIFTINTVEVYKVFKGQELETIEVITPGGKVGGMAQNVSHGLALRSNDIGVFTLYSASADKQFKPYSGMQGFYRYDLNNNTSSNPFSKNQDIKSSLYKNIEAYTKSKYRVLSNFTLGSKFSKSRSAKSVLVPTDISFSPSIISAGTKTLLTITGNDFGTQGKVGFRNADSGGLDDDSNPDYLDALDSEVFSWSDSEIVVEVPSFAGTGDIRIIDGSGDIGYSTSDLTVSYALLTVESGGNVYPYQYYDDNGDGGLTWQMNLDFSTNIDAVSAYMRAFNKWRCETKINWIIGDNTSVSISSGTDNVNVITFDTASNPLSEGTLGQTITTTSSCNNTDWIVIDVDMIFDTPTDDPFSDPDKTPWNFGPGPTGFAFDFESIALHELGHAHGLGHVIDNNDAMDFNLAFAQDVRSLNSSNIEAGNIVKERSVNNMLCGEDLMTEFTTCSLSVEDDELENSIALYPNPANTEFSIKNTASINLEKIVIYDANGRLITQYDILNSSRINKISLKGISKGLYFVNIKSNNASINRKLIVN